MKHGRGGGRRHGKTRKAFQSINNSHAHMRHLKERIQRQPTLTSISLDPISRNNSQVLGMEPRSWFAQTNLFVKKQIVSLFLKNARKKTSSAPALCLHSRGKDRRVQHSKVSSQSAPCSMCSMISQGAIDTQRSETPEWTLIRLKQTFEVLCLNREAIFHSYLFLIQNFKTRIISKPLAIEKKKKHGAD